MKQLNFVVCGSGCRGASVAKGVIVNLEDVRIVGVSDLYEDKAEKLAADIEEMTGFRPAVYTDSTKMVEELKPDVAYVATSWESHTEVSIMAMEHGVAVAMEVGGAHSEEECRSLIEAWEKTRVPFMFMENCCFNRDELFALSLARNGVLGNVVYCHGAYGHDLRNELAYGDIKRHYRLKHYSTRNCENYPTHELGPICRLLNITRGNRMVSLVSRSSKSLGLHEYVQDKPDLEYLRDREFAQGDIVETLITCENGELISLRLDTTLPRTYSREFTVAGTKGRYVQDTNSVFRDGCKETFNIIEGTNMYLNNATELYDPYLPEFWRNITEEQKKAGHGGMDYFEFLAFVNHLRAGEPMPIDVYEAATWMSITYLSEKSLAMGGAVVEMPDFTAGAYKTRVPFDVVDLPKVEQ
ncbi:MAG: Gfo/Idh/MocA family oxidoreductase [Clostridia bacterium]|nr:Gfo/Idh/MocA family oxidoreductase [Clostridia bacterium]